MFITDLSIKRPVVSSVFSLILVVFGLFIFWKLPVRELPSGLQPPVVQVQVDYKSASASIKRRSKANSFLSNPSLFLVRSFEYAFMVGMF